MKKLMLLVFGLFSLFATAQTQVREESYSLSLEEAVALGMENNYSSQISEKDVEKALKQKWEIISQGLPQIAANVDYQNYIEQPVTLIPGEIAGGEPGTFFPARFGTKQNMAATATWSQLIFDGSYIVGVQSARTLLQISKNAKTKTDLEVRKAVINAYGNVLMAEESVEIIRKNLRNIEKNLNDTRQIVANGLAEEEDAEQLKITQLSLQNNLSRSTRMLEIAYQMLNMAMGIPVETPVTLTENLDALAAEFIDLQLLEKEVPVEENIDYRIAENSAESAAIFVRLEKAKALPTLTGFLNIGATGNSDKFTFLSDDQKYYSQSILGINLSVPIFSSGMRSARTAQKEIEYEQALLELEETRNRISLEKESARSDYRFSLENFQTTQESLELARRIERKNQVKFYEGLASSFELNEAQRQLYNAQQNLLQAMLDVINAKVELENILATTTYEEIND